MTIPFKQYVAPHGREKEVSIDRPAEIEALARQFMDRGGWFECEVLSTTEVSLTACKKVRGEPQDVDIEICSNGPEVPQAVDRLVQRVAA